MPTIEPYQEFTLLDFPANRGKRVRRRATLGATATFYGLPENRRHLGAMYRLALYWMLGGVVLCSHLGSMKLHIPGRPDLDSVLNGIKFVVAIGGLLFFPSAVYWLWPRLLNWLRQTRLDRSNLSVAVHPLRPGTLLDGVYMQRVSRPATIQSIDVRFFLRESVTFSSGTDVFTKHHDHLIGEFKRDGQHMQADWYIDERIEFSVPANGVPSVIGQWNRLQYFLSIRIRLVGWVDYFALYEIRVEA